MFRQKPSTLSDVAIISAGQLRQLMDTTPDVIVINVLSDQVYVDCHITGSINIPYDRLVETVASWDKDKEIVVYCAQDSCPKSRQAYELLLDLGFTHVYQYAAGMKDWFKNRFDVTGICTLRYLHE